MLATIRKKRVCCLRWAVLAAFLYACGPLAALVTSQPLVHNGYNRAYLLYRPAHFSSRPVVVIMLGGTGSTAKSTSEEFGWVEQAERSGFLVAFPEPAATDPSRPTDRNTNPTFWDLKGSRTHLVGRGMQQVDDDGYLMDVIRDVLRREKPARIFLAGFSSGSGMVQLFGSHHAKYVAGIVAVATPLMEPPIKLARPVPILYIHGDEDEQFSGFEVNSPHFATTPHGNWVTWGKLDECEVETATKTAWGVEFSWQGCKHRVPVVADFIAGLGHEWPGSLSSQWNKTNRNKTQLDLTALAWHFFSSVQAR